MSDSPWKDLTAPTVAGTINARRFSIDIPWGFYWAVDVTRRCLLVFRISAPFILRSRLPKLKGIEVSLSDSDSAGESVLTFLLLDSAHRDIFQRLCEDIVASASKAPTEGEAIDIAIARTWRWHHLLRGGGDQRLTDEEQKGLIGELLVLERYLIPNFSPTDSVLAWHGPLGAPKDFELGRRAIECKARRGGAVPSISITSEDQLDETEKDALFLHVVTLDRAAIGATNSFTITDVARRVRDCLNTLDQLALDRFEGLMAAAGFRWEDDYSDYLWVDGMSRFYKVVGEFPRIVSSGLQGGVHHVKYSISLAECEPYLVSEQSVLYEISGD